MVEKEGVTVGVGVLVQPYKPSSHDSLPPERERERERFFNDVAFLLNALELSKNAPQRKKNVF